MSALARNGELFPVAPIVLPAAIFEHPRARVLHGDSKALFAQWPANSIDSCVTDAPYELGFMGKAWDRSGIAFDPEFWSVVFRALKPGAHLLACGGTRTYHRMACAIEDAGFEIRDSLHWFYGTGFPKSLNVGEGRGTALKPAHEPIVLARKPLIGTVAENLNEHGTGALNIDACRIGTADTRAPRNGTTPGFNLKAGVVCGSELGRWPANVLLDVDAAAELDDQTNHLKRGGRLTGDEPGTRDGLDSFNRLGARAEWEPYGDEGGASRFFYVAKPTRARRDLGCEHLEPKSGGEATDREEGTAGISPRAGAGRGGGARNFHPTVKPVALMRYLVRLITPPGGQVLDPFVGSASTGIAALCEGRTFVGAELTAEYGPIIAGRLQAAIDGRFS